MNNKDLENLKISVENHILNVIENEMKGWDGISMLSNDEKNSIASKALTDSGAKERISLHASAWADDAIAYAKRMLSSSVTRKLKSAARSASKPL